jgi:hypothetical protein
MTCRNRSSGLTRPAQLACFFAASLFSASVAFAQGEPGKEPAKPMAAPAWMQARNLLGTKIAGLDGKQLGEIADVVFLPYGGVFDAAVVKVAGGEHKVKVPFSSLQWKAEDRSYTTGMTREQITAMPRFDPQDYSSDTAKQPADAATTGKAAEVAGAAAKKPAQFLLLSDLEQRTVNSSGGVLGRIVQAITESNPRSVVFVTVKAGTDLADGDIHPVPWRALRLDETGKLTTSVDATKLSSAPKLERIESLEDPEFLRKVTAFYGVPAISLPKTGESGTR